MDIIKLTQKLISFQTTADNLTELKKCADYLANFFKETGLKVERFQENGKPAVVVTVSGQKNAEIFLNGHFDVVPGSPEQFRPVVKDGKLYGRGAYDMKGALAVMVWLMRDLSQERSPLLENVGLMLVGDEEVGGFHGSKYLLEQGYKPKCLIVGEPTDFAIGYQAKGVLWLKLTAKGKSAHGAYPWKGKNAITKMIQVLGRLTNEFPVPNKEVWQTSLNLGKIEGGQATNVVPSRCEANLDIRYLPGEDVEALIKKVSSIAAGVEVEVVMREPAVSGEKEGRYAALLGKETEVVLGKKAIFATKHGSYDGRFFAAVGVRSFEFGPVGAGHHSETEWVDIDSLDKYYKILKSFLKSSL